MLVFPIRTDCLDEVYTSQQIVFNLSQHFLPFMMTQQYQPFHCVQHEFAQSFLDIKVKVLLFVFNVPLTQILIGVADDIQKDQAD
jgi:hypothetical protein